MSILKFENRTPKSLEEMYNYMIDPQKTQGTKFLGIGVNPSAPVEEMRFVQEIYGREDLLHPYVQIIFSCDKNVEKSKEELYEICMQIGQLLISDNRQVFGAIHYYGTNNIHFHYMINYVGMNGSLYRQNHHVHHYMYLVNEVLKKHNLQLINIYQDPSIG